MHQMVEQMATVQDYESHIGGEAVDRIMEKIEDLGDFHVAHVNSTFYGGGGWRNCWAP